MNYIDYFKVAVLESDPIDFRFSICDFSLIFYATHEPHLWV